MREIQLEADSFHLHCLSLLKTAENLNKVALVTQTQTNMLENVTKYHFRQTTLLCNCKIIHTVNQS